MATGRIIFLNGTSSSGKSSIARGDRPPGLAARQYGLVHRHGVYDLECDTGADSPRACAERIRDLLPDRPRPTAFTRLRGGGPTP
jgi:chloramphenicol 3-O phosphotransferase